MSDKVYFNGLSIKTGKYGLRVSVNVEKFVAELQQYKDQKGYVNIDVKERKSPSQYGHTHTATLDTWQPSNAAASTNEEQLPF